MRPTVDTRVSFNPRMHREIGTLMHDGTMVPYSALTTAVQSMVTTIAIWWVDRPIFEKRLLNCACVEPSRWRILRSILMGVQFLRSTWYESPRWIDGRTGDVQCSARHILCRWIPRKSLFRAFEWALWEIYHDIQDIGDEPGFCKSFYHLMLVCISDFLIWSASANVSIQLCRNAIEDSR